MFWEERRATVKSLISFRRNTFQKWMKDMVVSWCCWLDQKWAESCRRKHARGGENYYSSTESGENSKKHAADNRPPNYEHKECPAAIERIKRISRRACNLLTCVWMPCSNCAVERRLRSANTTNSFCAVCLPARHNFAALWLLDHCCNNLFALNKK